MLSPDAPRPPRSLFASAVTFAVFCFGAVFCGFGLFSYGFWMEGGPGAGFFPTVFGGGTALLAALDLARPAPVAARVRLKNHAPVIAMVAAIALISVIGMVPAMTLFVLLWLRLVERAPWRRSILVAAATGLSTTLLFDVWLRVAFPESLLSTLF